MNKRAPSFGASLIELIVAVAVFAVVSALCVQIFARATRLSRESADLSRAIVLAQSAGEAYRQTGSGRETADILGGYVLPQTSAHTAIRTEASSESDISYPPLPASGSDLYPPVTDDSSASDIPSPKPEPKPSPPPSVTSNDLSFVVYYDADGKLTGNERDAAYTLFGVIGGETTNYCDISVRLSDGGEIFAIRVAGRVVAP